MYFCYFAFLNVKGRTFENRKIVLISLQKLFWLLRYSKFWILQSWIISWRHQMPQHKTRNTFYWTTLEGNIVWYWNLVCYFIIARCFFLKKNCQSVAKTCHRPISIFKESSVNSNLRMSAFWFWHILAVLYNNLTYLTYPL